MNFLAHYFFDHRKANPHFNLGLLLPDLVRNFEPGVRLKLVGASFDGLLERSILDGCLQHTDTDKIFHAWSGFHKMMAEVTTIVRNAEHDIDKDWFVAHILVELVMDHFLTLKHTDLANRLYTDFEQLDMTVVQSFLARNNLPNFERFESGFDKFMTIRYLDKYQDIASIVFALGKICTKVKLKPFTEGQKKTIEICIQSLLPQMPEQLDILHDELI